MPDDTFSCWVLLRFKIKTVSWLSSGGGTPSQTPFCMRGASWQPSSSFERSTPPKTAMLYQRSHYSAPSRTKAETYLPRSPTYMRRRPRRHFQRNSLDMRLTQSHIRAELRALLSPADADCAKSDGCSDWKIPRTKTLINSWSTCARFEMEKWHVRARFQHRSRGTVDLIVKCL